MCGITGIVRRNGEGSVRQETLDEMTDALAHRGPDGRGTVTWGKVGFGNRRLAIIDIDHGDQPLSINDGDLTIVYNGEIYNHDELRANLRELGHEFETETDTEVVLHLYDRYGLDMFEHLNGMFAFGIYDRTADEIVLGRDRFGQKPLYVYEDDDVVLFASEIKALLRHPVVERRPDPRGVQEYLTFQHCLGSRTMFANVRHVEPAHFLVLDGSGHTVEEGRYWRFDVDTDDSRTAEEHVRLLRSRIEEAVEMRIPDEVDGGAYVSGGLDSGIVAGIAARKAEHTLPAFTGYFEEEGFSELPYAAAVAEQTDSPLHSVCPTPEDFADTLEELIFYMDEPAAGPGSFPQLMVSRLASEHVKVVLGGQGGDELFGGYARYLVLYLEACIKGSIFQEPEEGSPLVTLEDVTSDLTMLQDYTPMIEDFWSDGLFQPLDERYFDLMSRIPDLGAYFTAEFLEERDEDAIFETYQDEFAAVVETAPDGRTSHLNRLTAFDLRAQFRALLQVEDRMSMANSLESRLPLLDHRIAELSYRIPGEQKFGDGKLKRVLQQAGEPYLPDEVLERDDKMGFPVPYVSWLQGPLREFADEILLGERAREREIYRIDRIEDLLDEERPNGRALWGILCLELWFRTYIDPEEPPARSGAG